MRASNNVFVDGLALWLSNDVNVVASASKGNLKSLNLLDMKKNKETSLPSLLSLLKATLITSDDNAPSRPPLEILNTDIGIVDTGLCIRDRISQACRFGQLRLASDWHKALDRY